MCELTETALRDDLEVMAKYGRLVGYDVSAPITTHPATQDKDVRPSGNIDADEPKEHHRKLYRDRHGDYWEINGTKAHKVPPDSVA